MGERVLLDLSDQEFRDEFCVTECEYRQLYDSKSAEPTRITPETCGRLAYEAGIPAGCGLAAISVELNAVGDK